MATYKNATAFPMQLHDALGQHVGDDIGLTKREIFAMAAMQGILAFDGREYAHEREIVRDAVSCADLLIIELNATMEVGGK